MILTVGSFNDKAWVEDYMHELDWKIYHVIEVGTEGKVVWYG